MAPVASSSTQVASDDVPVEEIVFSCAICQATLSEVYATTEYNKGFHSGSGDDDGIVTKMWITECSHVTCAKHLENGGVYRCQLILPLGTLTVLPQPHHSTRKAWHHEPHAQNVSGRRAMTVQRTSTAYAD